MDYRIERRKNIRKKYGGSKQHLCSALNHVITVSHCLGELMQLCVWSIAAASSPAMRRFTMNGTKSRHRNTHSPTMTDCSEWKWYASNCRHVRQCLMNRIVDVVRWKLSRHNNRANSPNEEHHQTISYANCRGDTAHNRFVTINELNRLDDVNFVARIHKPNTFVSPIRAEGMRITRSETKTFPNYRFRIIRFRRQGDNRDKEFGHQIDCQCV